MSLPAPWTLAQIRSEIFVRCTINTGGDRGARSLPLVDSAIRRAIRELETGMPWLVLVSSVTIDLVDDTAQYDFPDPMDPGKYYEVFVRNAESEKLFPLRANPSQTEKNANLGDDATSGRPNAYWFEDSALSVTPLPDTDNWDQLVIRGQLRAGASYNDTDLVPIDGEAVVQRAVLILRPLLEKPVTQDMKDMHLAYLRDLRGNQSDGSGSLLGGDTSVKCAPQDGPALPRNAFQYDSSWQPPGFWGP